MLLFFSCFLIIEPLWIQLSLGTENPVAAIGHTNNKLKVTIPVTAQVDRTVRASLEVPVLLTLLSHTCTCSHSPGLSSLPLGLIMQVCSWTTLSIGLHFGCLLRKYCTALSLCQCYLFWDKELPASCFLLPALILMAHAVQSVMLIYCFSDMIIILPFHWEITRVYNNLGVIFTSESLSHCLIVFSHQLHHWEVWLTSDSRSTLLPLSWTHPWLWGDLLPQDSTWGPFWAPLPTLTQKLPPATFSLQMTAGLPCPCPVHPSLDLTWLWWPKSPLDCSLAWL